MEDLLGRHGRSAYVGRIRLAHWEKVLADQAPVDRANRKAGIAPDQDPREKLLQEIEATDLSHTAFEADRLLLVAKTRDAMGDRKGARLAYERLAREHPDTTAAERATTRLRLEEEARKEH